MRRGLGALALAGALVAGSALSACYVTADVPPAVFADGYAPAYYDGYIVYFDDLGRPYYYAGGAVFWVPPSAPVYPGLATHWRLYAPQYRRWYVHYGYRYRAYRARR